MEKAELRKKGQAVLKKLSQQPKRKADKELIIRQLLFASEAWQKAQTIGLVRSTKEEFNNELIFFHGFAQGKRLVVPEVLPQRQLLFHEVGSKSIYAKSAFGIEEPVDKQPVLKEEIDLLLVPGLLFSPEGYRIGYGGGYYDRFLTDFSGKTISLVFQEQLASGWQPDTFDVPVQRIITDCLEKRGN